jgi:hypothetical protein
MRMDGGFQWVRIYLLIFFFKFVLSLAEGTLVSQCFVLPGYLLTNRILGKKDLGGIGLG